MSGIQEIEGRVTGRVQRVMYRDFAQRRARSLQLAGEVENLSDGSVRVVAQGSRKDLEQYIRLLRKGPLLARVEDVAVEWRTPARDFSGFKIVF